MNLLVGASWQSGFECGPPWAGQSCVVPPWSAPEPFELLGAIEKNKISDMCYICLLLKTLSTYYFPTKKFYLLATQPSF